MSAFFENGFFVRKPAWHGLGNVLERAPANHEEALISAGLDWDVNMIPMSYSHKGTWNQAPVSALVRETDGQYYGKVAGCYQILQNSEAMRWCQPLVDTELWSFETGGSLQDGKWCWALLKQDEKEIVPNDVLKDYLLFTWNHSGQNANTVMPTSVRVVCNNTLTAALDGGGRKDRVTHNCSMPRRMSEIQAVYKEMSFQFARQHELFERLVNVEWAEEKLGAYVDTLFPVDREANLKAQTIARHDRDAVFAMVVEGEAAGAKELGVQGTAYGAFMGVSEFNEHYAGGQRVKDQGLNVLFGNASKANEKALTLAVDMAGLTS